METVSAKFIDELVLALWVVFCPLQEINMVKLKKIKSAFNFIVCLLGVSNFWLWVICNRVLQGDTIVLFYIGVGSLLHGQAACSTMIVSAIFETFLFKLPGASLFYLIKMFTIKSIKSLPCTPPHIARSILIHTLNTTAWSVHWSKNCKSFWVSFVERWIKSRSTASCCNPNNTRLFDIYAPKFGSS